MWLPIATILVVSTTPEPGLTLAGAVQMALESHEDARIALLRYEEARARRQQVWARILPHASLSGSMVYRPASTLRASGIGDIDIDSRVMWTGRASLQSNLIDLGFVPDLLRANREVEAQGIATAESQRQLAFAVAQQFLLALAAEQLLAATTKRLDVANATVEDAQQRVAAGIGRRSDVTRAELERSASQLSVVEAARDVDLTRLGLADLLGSGHDTYARATLVTPQESFIETPASLEVLLVEGRESRSDLAYARLLVEAAQHAVWENLAGFLPTVGAMADVTKQDDGFVDRDPEWSVALFLSWRLYEGGRRLAEDNLREARLEIADLEARKLGRTVEREVQSAHRRHQASLAQLGEAGIQADLANRNLDETRAMFQHGLTTALERIDAMASAFEADAELARRQLEARLAELEILASVGAWPLDSIRPVLQ
ncbi:TolC family protein [Myxococcota bacterium]